MKIWRSIAIFLMGVAAALLIAMKMQKPGTVINQQIKKMKTRGTGNTQEATMNNVLPESGKPKKGLFGFLKVDPEKKAARKAEKEARRAARKKK